MELTIRRAKPSDALFLTSISFGAKRYWNYSEEYLETWHDELTITEEYIEENVVFVAQKKDTIIGYCSVTEVEKAYWKGENFIKAGYWLDHIYIRPAYIRSGIGSKLIEELICYCRENDIEDLNILSDPNANGFFDKIEAIYTKDMPSSVEERETCLFEFHKQQEGVSALEEEALDILSQDEVIEAVEIEEIAIDYMENNIEIEEPEADDIFEVFRFNKQEFEMEREDLEKKRMRLEQEVLGQKLYELDKDIDDEEIYDLSEEKNDEEEYEYHNEEREEVHYPQEYVRDKPIVNFEFTTSIGYKFECEEEQDTLEWLEVEGKEPTVDEQEEKGSQYIIQESEQLEGQEIAEEIGQLEEQEIEEVIEQPEGQEIEEEKEQLEDQILEVASKMDSNDEIVIDKIQELEGAKKDVEASVYENEEVAVGYLQEVAESVELYSIIEEEDLYHTSREEESNFQEAQYIREKVADKAQGKEINIESQEKQDIHVKTEKEKMLEGEQYIAWGDEIVKDRRRARRILKEFNLVTPEDKKQALSLLKELFGSTGEYIHIEPDFKCNYGYNIHIGDNFYAGYNCVILDNAKVTIGDNCILSPQVGIYTLAYPINSEKRIAGYEYAEPITVGNNVWIGGGTVINAGVTIGNDVVILPGSVITSDIPQGVTAGGNPARIIKEIDE